MKKSNFTRLKALGDTECLSTSSLHVGILPEDSADGKEERNVGNPVLKVSKLKRQLFKQHCEDNNVVGVRALLAYDNIYDSSFEINAQMFECPVSFPESLGISKQSGMTSRYTPLMRACYFQQHKLVELLVNHFAYVLDYDNVFTSVCICIGRSTRCLSILVNHSLLKALILKNENRLPKVTMRIFALWDRIIKTRCIESMQVMYDAHPLFARIAFPSLVQCIEEHWEEGIDYLTSLGLFLYATIVDRRTHMDIAYLLELIESGRVHLYARFDENGVMMPIDIDRLLYVHGQKIFMQEKQLLRYLANQGQVFVRSDTFKGSANRFRYLAPEDQRFFVKHNVFTHPKQEELHIPTIVEVFNRRAIEVFLMASVPTCVESDSNASHGGSLHGGSTHDGSTHGSTHAYAHAFFHDPLFEPHLVPLIMNFM